VFLCHGLYLPFRAASDRSPRSGCARPLKLRGFRTSIPAGCSFRRPRSRSSPVGDGADGELRFTLLPSSGNYTFALKSASHRPVAAGFHVGRPSFFSSAVKPFCSMSVPRAPAHQSHRASLQLRVACSSVLRVRCAMTCTTCASRTRSAPRINPPAWLANMASLNNLDKLSPPRETNIAPGWLFCCSCPS